jgi:hypothetical protein
MERILLPHKDWSASLKASLKGMIPLSRAGAGCAIAVESTSLNPLNHSRLLSGPAGVRQSPLPYGRVTSPSGRFPQPESSCWRRNEYAIQRRPVRSTSLNSIHSVKKQRLRLNFQLLAGASWIDAAPRRAGPG